jgi:hypothetical protein
MNLKAGLMSPLHCPGTNNFLRHQEFAEILRFLFA